MSFASQLQSAIIEAPNAKALDNLARLLWRGLAEGHLDEAAAEGLSAAVEARRTTWTSLSHKPIKPLLTRPRACRTADRDASILRRRRLAASGALPPALAARFTTGELAVLAVIGRESQRGSRHFSWFMDRLAAVAGVSRTTARNALREAERLGLISVTERRINRDRNDSNVIAVTSREWLAWLRLDGRRGGGCKKLIPTTNQELIESRIPTASTSATTPFYSCSRQGLVLSWDDENRRTLRSPHRR